MNEKKKKTIVRILGVLFWIGVWQTAAAAVGLELLLPGPGATARVFVQLIGESFFWHSIFLSILRILSGFLLGIALGSVLAVVTAFVPYTEEFVYPVLSVMKATPVASFIILLILWMRSTYVPVIAVLLMVLPISWSNVMTGLRGTDKKLLEMAKMYEFGRLKTFRLVYLPAVSSYFYTACVMSIGFAWKSGIAAEVISMPNFSIGTNLYRSKVYLETAQLFAWTVVIILLSVCIEKLFKLLIANLENKGAKSK